MNWPVLISGEISTETWTEEISSPLNNATIAVQENAKRTTEQPLDAVRKMFALEPNRFLKPQNQFDIEGWTFQSSSTKTCSSCNSKGNVSCSSCSGRGETPCTNIFCSYGQQNCSGCSGTGRRRGSAGEAVLCYQCGGRGTYNCSTCNGANSVHCGRCGGTGSNTCTPCFGTGNIHTLNKKTYKLHLDIILPPKVDLGRFEFVLQDWNELSRLNLFSVDLQNDNSVDGEIHLECVVSLNIHSQKFQCDNLDFEVDGIKNGNQEHFHTLPFLGRILKLSDTAMEALNFSELIKLRVAKEAAGILESTSGPVAERKLKTAKLLSKTYGKSISEIHSKNLVSILRIGLEKEKKKVSSKVKRKFRQGNFFVSFCSFLILFLLWAFGTLSQFIPDGEQYFLICIGFIFTFWVFSLPAKKREKAALIKLETSLGLDGKIQKNSGFFGSMAINFLYSLIGAFLALIATIGLAFFTQVIPAQARYDYINIYSNFHENLDAPIIAPSKQALLSQPLSLYRMTGYPVFDEFDHADSKPLKKLVAGDTIKLIGEPLGNYRLVLLQNEIALAPIADINLAN